MADHPYQSLKAEAFWKTGVAEPGIFGLSGLWRTCFEFSATPAFATFGSCFAQHIGREVKARGMSWVDGEPAPPLTPPDVAREFNYGVFSARTANIYTTPQLAAWVELAAEPDSVAAVEIWEDDGRWRDCLRPLIEPEGFDSEAETRTMLRASALGFRTAVQEADVFVFTMGLTEGWENPDTGQVYALCPGTQAGQFDPDLHVFRNYDYLACRGALERALEGVWSLNPALKILLTVSPVPLVATASGQHVLSAVGYSKATLRAVAGDLAQSFDVVDYFPSYEIITGAPARAMFFEPDLRSVARQGVDVVMTHFFAGLGVESGQMAPVKAEEDPPEPEDLICEERILESYANG